MKVCNWIIVVVLNAAAVGPVISSQISHINPGPEVPLEFSDILPENPKSYDKMEPPKQQGKPTVVYFHVTVMSLDSIDESSMTYAADIFFSQMWQDYRLRFPDNLTADYRLLPTSWLRQMWRPDSFFKNAKKVTFQDITIPNHYIWLYKDKSILYMVKLTLILSCSMNFKLYPHDTQQCAMKIESLSHTTDDLVFVWEKNVPLAVDERIELPQLDLVSNLTGDCTQVYSTGNFTCLEIVFSFRRRLGYYLFHTYVPTCLIVIMSWISFWIRPEAVPARVTLGVTSLLTLSTQHANSQKSLPPVSYIKAIDIFMSGCTVFVFCSLMEYALVNIVMGDFIEGDDSALRRGMKSIFVASGFGSHKHNSMKESSKSLHSPQQQQQQQQQQQILRVSQSMLPVCSRSLQNEHHAQIHPIASGVESEMLRDPPHQPSLIRRPVNSKEGNNGPNLNAIVPDTPPTAPHPPSANNYLIPHGENGRPPTVPTLCGRTQQTEAPLAGSEGPKSSPFGLFSQPTTVSLHQIRRNRAITIDRLSRLLFPVSFFILNAVYWSVFIDWS